jgi:hypothetical protein
MVVDYGWFAERHHWTPAQVDELPPWYRNRLPAYTAILDQLEREAHQREQSAEQARAALSAGGRSW